MLLSLTILAACGLFNPPPQEVTTPVVAPPAPWQDAFVKGSLVAVTPDNFQEVWKTVRHDGRSNSDWVMPGIPMECPDDFVLALNYMVDLGECFCSYHLGDEPSANPPVYEDQYTNAHEPRRSDPYWVDLASSGCVAITEHDGQWWKGVKMSSVRPVSGNDEFTQEFYSQPICTSVESDGGVIDLGDLHDQGSGQ
jgi:hypothetical protein